MSSPQTTPATPHEFANEVHALKGLMSQHCTIGKDFPIGFEITKNAKGSANNPSIIAVNSNISTIFILPAPAPSQNSQFWISPTTTVRQGAYQAACINLNGHLMWQVDCSAPISLKVAVPKLLALIP